MEDFGPSVTTSGPFNIVSLFLIRLLLFQLRLHSLCEKVSKVPFLSH
jgi:hypothetical protein